MVCLARVDKVLTTNYFSVPLHRAYNVRDPLQYGAD